MKQVNLIVLALLAVSLLAAPLALGQGANPPASTKESGATSGKGMTAVEQSGSSQKAPAGRYVNLPKVVQAPFSDGVLAGNTLYIAGRLGLDPNGKVPGDIEQEARIVLDGVKSVLTEAGMTMDDLVLVQVFCPDVSLYAKFNDVYKTYFGKDYPARAFVGSGALLRGAHFEINGIAVKR
jgi:2-iminobutanoate/2-iminopropanoate deaminase